MNHRSGAWLAFVLVVAAGAAVPWLLLEPDLTCDSDEGYHLLPALTYQRDLANGDVTAFLRHTAKAGRYPFLHGWYLGGLFLVLGPSYLVARASSAVLLGVACGLAWLLLRRVRPGTHPLWALPLLAILALAPENLTMAVLCMLEIPGLVLTLLAAWLYHRFLERPESKARGALVGLTVAALFFVKFPYAAYVLLPIGLHELWRVRRAPWRLLRPASLLAWGTGLGVFGLCLVVPWLRQGIVDFLAVSAGESSEAGRDPSEIPHVQPDLVLFYLKTVLWRITPGAVSGLAVLAGAVLFAIGKGKAFVRLVLLGTVIWTVFTLTLSFRTYGVDRFLVPVGGLLVVAGVAGWADVARRMARWEGVSRAMAVGPLVVLAAAATADAAWQGRKLPERARRAVETGEDERREIELILDAIPWPANVLLVGSRDELSESAVKAHFLITRPDAHYEDLDVSSIRLARKYEDTSKLDRWVEQGSRWNPRPGETRHRVIVVFRPSAELAERIPDPRVWRTIMTRVEAVIGPRPARATWAGPAGTVEVHVLADGGGD